jgi:hypothetical protein
MPATGANSGYPAEVGRDTLPTWSARGRSAFGLTVMVVFLGTLVAVSIVVVALLAWVIVSAAIN